MALVLYLMVELRGDRYAIPSGAVVEVIPYLRVKALPGAPAGLAGLVNYRGDVVPVVDLYLLAFGTPTPSLQSARTIIVSVTPADGRARTLGVLVPRARETVRLDPAAFQPPPIPADGARFLGPVLTDERGVIQRVSIEAMLTPELLDALMAAETEAAGGGTRALGRGATA
jgi:chemotaxis-related protein WspB